MTTALSSVRETPGRERAPSRSWIDVVMAAIEAWPWPVGWSLVGLYLMGVTLLHVIAWTLGGLPAGTLDPFIATWPLYPILILAFLALQNRVSVAALARFRPAIDLEDEAYRELEREFTQQPPRSALVAGVAAALLGLVIELTKDGAPEQMERNPAAFAILAGVSSVFYSFMGPWLVRAYRLLRLVRRLHGRATKSTCCSRTRHMRSRP